MTREVDGARPRRDPRAVTPLASAQTHRSIAATPRTMLPVGDMFAPLIADLKAAAIPAAFLLTDSPVLDPQVGAVGFGETFGLLRMPGRRPGDGWQIDLAGAVFAQFEMQRQSTDLVNADYLVGLPITYRRGKISARLDATPSELPPGRRIPAA